MKHTEGMEKAMHANYGVGYAEYNQKHEVRMEVEQQREKDYQKSQQMAADVNRNFTNHI
ncbi:hypothetical protein SAMN05443094_105212 [Domibacillus enclensis]|uniref:Uncharacterized protein n=2 Tax=Domibacillus enclensis TaxID=1017273 RepID=A0A1N6YAE5_9BACI|nr:hypothetical protein SAMN05443094_105212 [Domibacillus enclensis]